MAAIKADLIRHPYSDVAEIWRWPNVTEADTCIPRVVPHKADKTVQVLGDLNGGTVEFQGALDPEAEGSDVVTLDDHTGAALSITDKKPRLVAQNAYLMAPKITAGAGMSVDVFLLISR